MNLLENVSIFTPGRAIAQWGCDAHRGVVVAWINEQTQSTRVIAGLPEMGREVALEIYVDPLCLLKISARVSPELKTDMIIQHAAPRGALSLKQPPNNCKLTSRGGGKIYINIYK